MNNSLMMLLHPNTDLIPTLSDECEMDFETLLNAARPCSQQVAEEQSLIDLNPNLRGQNRLNAKRLSDFNKGDDDGDVRRLPKACPADLKDRTRSWSSSTFPDTEVGDGEGPRLSDASRKGSLAGDDVTSKLSGRPLHGITIGESVKSRLNPEFQVSSTERTFEETHVIWKSFEVHLGERGSKSDESATLPSLPKPHSFRNASRPLLQPIVPPEAWIYRARSLLDRLQDPQIADKTSVMSELLQHMATKQLESVGREMKPTPNGFPQEISILQTNGTDRARVYYPEPSSDGLSGPTCCDVSMQDDVDGCAHAADDGHPTVS